MAYTVKMKECVQKSEEEYENKIIKLRGAVFGGSRY